MNNENLVSELKSWCDKKWILDVNKLYLDFTETFTLTEIEELYHQNQKEVDFNILNMIRLGKSKAGIIFSSANDLIKCLIYYRFGVIRAFLDQEPEYTHEILDNKLNSALLSLLLMANFHDVSQYDENQI